MDYRKIGRTGLRVSNLCLGTMQWGWTAGQETAFAIMDAFVDSGGNPVKQLQQNLAALDVTRTAAQLNASSE